MPSLPIPGVKTMPDKCPVCQSEEIKVNARGILVCAVCGLHVTEMYAYGNQSEENGNRSNQF